MREARIGSVQKFISARRLTDETILIVVEGVDGAVREEIELENVSAREFADLVMNVTYEESASRGEPPASVRLDALVEDGTQSEDFEDEEDSHPGQTIEEAREQVKKELETLRAQQQAKIEKAARERAGGGDIDQAMREAGVANGQLGRARARGGPDGMGW